MVLTNPRTKTRTETSEPRWQDSISDSRYKSIIFATMIESRHIPRCDNMFKNSIPGLDKVFRTDIQPPKVVLITGPPGSMKTSFCYSLMSSYLEKSKEFGLYVTLEESGRSHLVNMRSLGMKVSNNLEISDFTDLRELDEVIELDSPTDYVQFVEQSLKYYKKKHGGSGALGNALLEMQAIIEPTKRYVVEERMKAGSETQEAGDPPVPGASGAVQQADAPDEGRAGNGNYGPHR